MESNLLIVSVSAGALVGCAQFSGVMAPADPSPAASAARGRGALQPPASRVRTGTLNDLGEMYRQGREAQEAQRLAAAEERYTRILAIDPRHADALNALGVLRARAGQSEEALGLFSRAVAAEPGSARGWNNRGYALLLAGRLDEAEADLQHALALEPASTPARGNLVQLAQARTTLDAAAVPEPQARVELVALAPQIYELREHPVGDATAAARSSSQVATGRASAAPALDGVRLEVSNGVGIRKMAWRTAKQLEALGTVTARLSNQPGYRQRVTEIQCRAGYQQAAHDLAARLAVSPPARQARLDPHVQVRLVLGRDLAGRELAVQNSTESAEGVVAYQATGWLLS